jgi:hypothetical protein
MIDPITISMLASAAISAGTGVYQSSRAKKMAEQAAARPTYEPSEEVKAALSDAERLALEGMPSEQKQQYIENIQRANQSALRAQAERKAGLAGIGMMHQNELDQYRNLLAMDAQAKRQNQQNLQSVRQGMQSIRDKEFQLNKYNPFLQEQQDIRDLQAAGMQNIMQGTQSAISGLGSAAQGKYELEKLKAMLAKKEDLAPRDTSTSAESNPTTQQPVNNDVIRDPSIPSNNIQFAPGTQDLTIDPLIWSTPQAPREYISPNDPNYVIPKMPNNVNPFLRTETQGLYSDEFIDFSQYGTDPIQNFFDTGHLPKVTNRLKIR